MNHWKVIWEAYHKQATTRNLFRSVIISCSNWERAVIAISATFFLYGVISLYWFPNISFWPIGISELVLVLFLSRMKKRLILREFGDLSHHVVPHNDEVHQTSRYLMFKQKLQERSITSNQVSDCMELLDLQIDIADSSGVLRKSFGSFVGGVFLGLITTLGRKLETTELIQTALTAAVAFFLIYLVLYIIPSKLEKLKEMKYFMLLYNREY
ncbi:hypothetical protein CAG64_05070 [Vibrio sp. V38_P2S17PM301]|uniref:hypothetical protein n=1 Tax=Vibrio sp. V38_P2S17PM301 TaxID=1938689 RepID=UPI0013610674|nr:hypothetical protein [Vibrio sp. V38_P2S17PM301]NAX24855.1 hypothetical protein [Vibrio sp. V38_P2S17PM301]